MTAPSSSSATAPNPFPVYPVAALRDIAVDIVDKTVHTEAVTTLDAAVTDYVARALKGERAGLAIPVRGDYGTGKTHLLTFTQARLRGTWAGQGGPLTLLSVPATETPFPNWYLTVVAPMLDRLDLPMIFSRLLAAAACEIADQVSLTAKDAESIRRDPLEVYPILRAGLLSDTDVERALVRSVATIAPRGSEELRSVLAALAWPQWQEAALKWLAGRTLQPVEREKLGVTRDLDPASEAEAVLVALAGAAARGGGLFALMIDEFEHLMAEDRRTNTHRNATAIKRLLEGMAGAQALVLVAGHWRAWEQLADFKARFAGQAPVDLVTLTASEIGRLATQYSPQWGPRLSRSVLESLAESCTGNIRKVMTTLHQLYSETAGGSGEIGTAAAAAAAETLRRLAADTGRPDLVIEDCARSVGGRVTREEAPFGQLRFDLAVRLQDTLRLIADVTHVSTAAELARKCEDFSIAVSALRSRHPEAWGLLVLTGATDEDALALADALPAVSVVRGDGPDWEPRLRTAVTALLRSEPPTPAETDEAALVSEEAARDALRESRQFHDAAATEARERVAALDFGEDERGAAASELAVASTPPSSTSYFGAPADSLDDFSSSMQFQAPTAMSFLLSVRVLPALLMIMLCICYILIFAIGGYVLVRNLIQSEIMVMPLLVMSIAGLLFGVVGIAFLYQREVQAYRRYRRWGRQRLEEMLISGIPSDFLLRAKNQLIDAPDAAGRFSGAFDIAQQHLRFVYEDYSPTPRDYSP